MRSFIVLALVLGIGMPTVAWAQPTPSLPPNVERHRERDHEPAAKAADTAAPRWLTLLAEQGAAGDGKVSARVRAANSFRIRGISGMADDSSGSVCNVVLKLGATSLITLSFIGRPDVANYMPLGGTAGIDVPPGAEVSLTTNATGTCTGLHVVLDTIP